MSKSKQEHLTATIKREPFDTYMHAVSELVSEAKLHIGPEGLETKAVDPANVAMVHAQLDASAFVDAPEADGTVGIATESFADAAPSEYDIELTYDASRRKMDVSSGVYWQEYATIDPDNVRTEPDLHDYGLSSRLTVKSDWLEDAIEWFHRFGSHVRMGYDPVEERLWMECIETNGSSTGTDERGLSIGRDELVSVSEHGESDSKFSLDYFRDIAAGLPDGDVELYIGKEYPMTFTHEFEHGSIKYMLAPRMS